MTSNSSDLKLTRKQLIEKLKDSSLSVSEKQKFLLENTVTFYGQDPINKRALDNSGECVYVNHDETKFCAVGRILPPEIIDFIKVEKLENSGFNELKKSLINQNLWPDYLETLGEDFLTSLQELHDFRRYWHVDSFSLSEEGQRFYQQLTQDIDHDSIAIS